MTLTFFENLCFSFGLIDTCFDFPKHEISKRDEPWALPFAQVLLDGLSFFFILVIKYIMQNFRNFEKSSEGITRVSISVHSQQVFGDQNVACQFSVIYKL